MIEITKNLFLFIKEWSNVGLIIVGTFALVVYWLQERKKQIEAASLIVLQIDELQKRLQEISTYTSNGSLDFGAFYESLPLMKDDYWNKYKHYFVKKMDSTSYTMIDTFYKYVLEINEQQVIIRELQKDIFYRVRNLAENIESNFFLKMIDSNDLDLNKYTEQQFIIKNILNKTTESSSVLYMPNQILKSLENLFKKYSMLQVIGTDGYRMLKKTSKRKL